MSSTVLHVITTLDTGGAEWALYNLLNGGLAERFDSHVISLSDAGTLGPRISELGVPVTGLGIRGALPSPATLGLLRRVARKAGAHLVQGWMYHGNIAALAARSLTPGRTALAWNVRHSLYQLDDEKPMTQRVIRANRLFSRSADAVLYNSQLSRQQHEAFGFASSHGHVLPNGIDLQRFRPSPQPLEGIRAELAIPDTALVVGHIGRFHPMKDHVGFLRAAASLCPQNPNLHFVLAGRGVSLQESALRKLVPTGAAGRFHFLGERKDVPHLMNAMDVFCQSSRAEAFPNVLGEAMAAGIPCVATDVGDSAAIVGDTGRVVPARNPGALADAIGELLAMSRVQRDEFGARARSRIEKRYALSSVVDRYAALYEQLISPTAEH